MRNDVIFAHLIDKARDFAFNIKNNYAVIINDIV
jgi:hypothetical protein